MEISANTFSGGLNLDQHPISIDNTSLTDALNATVLTNNGNEIILQNDMGNTLIQDSRTGQIIGLSEGFVPLGMKEHGGILYIASYNPKTQEGELGSIPSPLITYKIGDPLSLDQQIPLTTEDEDIRKSTIQNYTKITDLKLKPGDAFYVLLHLERTLDYIDRTGELVTVLNTDWTVPGKMTTYAKNYFSGDPDKQTQLEKTLVTTSDIKKYLFNTKEKGKGLYSVDLYTKTQEYGELKIEGLQDKEVQFYLKDNNDIRRSQYWFLDYTDLEQLMLVGEDKPLNLDMMRSISAECFLTYPNYPSGYLSIKLNTEIPQIEGMFINKSTGIKSPYLYEQRTLDIDNQPKSNYYIVIPGFYCQSGALTIDKIELSSIYRNSYNYGPYWETDRTITRTLTRGDDPETNYQLKFPDENNKRPENESTFNQIFDLNSNNDRSVIVPNVESLGVMLGEMSTKYPGNQQDVNYGIYAFQIHEDDLNSVFKMTFKFYSSIKDKEDWSLTPTKDYLLVQEISYYYTPRAIVLESVTTDAAELQQLQWPTDTPPELKLNDSLFRLKDNNIYTYDEKKLPQYSSDNVTYWQQPFVKVHRGQDNCIIGIHTAIGPRAWGGNWYDTGTDELQDYRASVISSVNKIGLLPLLIDSGSEDHRKLKKDKIQPPNDALGPLKCTKADLKAKGLYRTNLNWFNHYQKPFEYKTTEEYFPNNPTIQTGEFDIKYLPWGGLDYVAGKTIRSMKTRTQFYETTWFPTGEGAEVTVQQPNGQTLTLPGSRYAARNFQAFTYMTEKDKGNNPSTSYNVDEYPTLDPMGRKVTPRRGNNRYIEWIFCFMKDFCPTAPIYVKGPTATDTYLMHRCEAFEKTLTYDQQKILFDTNKQSYLLNEKLQKRIDSNYKDKLMGIFYYQRFQVIERTPFFSNLSYFYRKPFCIDIINKNKDWYRMYQMVNAKKEANKYENDDDSWCTHYQGIYLDKGHYQNNEGAEVEYIVTDIDNKFKKKNRENGSGSCTFAPDITKSNFNILQTTYDFDLTTFAWIHCEPYSYQYRQASGLVATIPSYQLFIDGATLDIKKKPLTDRSIHPYFRAIDSKNKEYNTQLGVVTSRLVREDSCGRYKPFDLEDLPENPKSYNLANFLYKASNTIKFRTYEDIEHNITGSLNGLGSPTVHILKIKGCVYEDNKLNFDNPVKIQSCMITFYDADKAPVGDSITIERDDIYECLVYVVPAGCFYYEVEITFSTEVVIKDIHWFEWRDLNKDDNYLMKGNDISETTYRESPSTGFYFAKDFENKITIQPMFPEYYVYCESGIECGGLTLNRCEHYPESPFARVHGYYTTPPKTGTTDDYSTTTNYSIVSNFLEYFYSGTPSSTVLNSITNFLSSLQE